MLLPAWQLQCKHRPLAQKKSRAPGDFTVLRWSFEDVELSIWVPHPTLSSGIIGVGRCLFTGFSFIHILASEETWGVEPVLVKHFFGMKQTQKNELSYPKTHHIIPKKKGTISLCASLLDVIISNKSLSVLFPRHPCLLVYVVSVNIREAPPVGNDTQGSLSRCRSGWSFLAKDYHRSEVWCTPNL